MTTSQPDLSPEFCRQRQQRVCRLLHQYSADQAVFVSPETIQYLTGFRTHRLMHAAVALSADGDCLLASPVEVSETVAADRVVTFPAQRLATLRQDQPEAALRALFDVLPPATALRIGSEFSAGGLHLQKCCDTRSDSLIDLDAELWRLRRCKDPDELAMIHKAISCTEAMYAAARDLIRPGVTELDVFCHLHAVAVQTAGEPLTALGNDFQCGSPGGPPRNRAAAAGELFILDLGPCYRGYCADNCRTVAVKRQITDQQFLAWETIVSVLDDVEKSARPGIACRDLFRHAKETLNAFCPDGFSHHLGHGIGLYPHEAPHLNPAWDDVLETGDVFTVEPGLYHESLRAGIRLEQNYRVVPDGVERMTNFPLEL